MKKFIAGFIVMASLTVAFIIGCSSPSPSGPGGSGPTATPTKTPCGFPGNTCTPTATATPQAVQAMVNLGTAANYVVLAYSQITNSGPSTLCGSLGLSPLTAVDGGIVVTCGGVRDVANTAASVAKTDLSTAYTDAAGRTGGALLAPGADIGGLTLYAGLYRDYGNLLVSSDDLTLDAQGNVNAVFIFQATGNLIVGPGRKVFLIGGAKANNIFWQVTGYGSLDTTAAFAGNIMAYTSVTLNTGAVLLGRALGENGNVTLLSNTITKPAP